MTDLKLCDWLAERELELTCGSHRTDAPECCVLEAEALMRGLEKTDDPKMTNTWDMRPINDITVPDALRTEWMCAMADAYRDCRDWPMERQKAVAERIVIETVRKIIADLPCLSDAIREQCRSVETIQDAAEAARAAEAAARAAAAWAAEAARAAAARAASRAAAAAAEAAWTAAAAARAAAAEWAAEAAWTAAEHIFIIACKIWLDAAKVQP